MSENCSCSRTMLQSPVPAVSNISLSFPIVSITPLRTKCFASNFHLSPAIISILRPSHVHSSFPPHPGPLDPMNSWGGSCACRSSGVDYPINDPDRGYLLFGPLGFPASNCAHPSALLIVHPDASMLQLPRFRRLKSVTVCAPGPCWSDLIYEIVAWFARDKKLTGEIADPACHASPSSVTSSMSSTTSATRAGRWEGTMVRFSYPVRKGDVDWRKLESAALGEDVEAQGCESIESEDGDESDHADGRAMRVNPIGKNVAGGRRSRRFAAEPLWVEVRSGSAVLGEVRGELGRLDQLGLLQVSCK